MKNENKRTQMPLLMSLFRVPKTGWDGKLASHRAMIVTRRSILKKLSVRLRKANNPAFS